MATARVIQKPKKGKQMCPECGEELLRDERHNEPTQIGSNNPTLIQSQKKIFTVQHGWKCPNCGAQYETLPVVDSIPPPSAGTQPARRRTTRPPKKP